MTGENEEQVTKEASGPLKEQVIKEANGPPKEQRQRRNTLPYPSKYKLQLLLSKAILFDCHHIAPQLFQIWHQYISLLPYYGQQIWQASYQIYKSSILECYRR